MSRFSLSIFYVIAFFDQSSKSHTEGSKEICEIGSKIKDVCSLANSPTLLPTKDILYIVSAIAGGLLIAFIIVSTVLAINITRTTCRRRGYGILVGGNDGPHGGGNPEDGNGNGRNGNGGNGNGGNGNRGNGNGRNGNGGNGNGGN